MKSKYIQRAPSFPAHPKYQKGESLPGYVYRYLSENGHFIDLQTERLLMELFRGLEGGFSFDNSIHALQRIYSLLGVGSEVTEAWFSIIAAAEKSYRLSHNFVYCPYCLAHHKIHFRVWGLKWVGYCRLHGDRLWKRCWNCHKLLRWSMIRADWHCQCGAILTVAEKNLTSQLNRPNHTNKQSPLTVEDKNKYLSSRRQTAKQIRTTITKSIKRHPEHYNRLAGRGFINRFNDSWEEHIAQDWPFSFQREIFRLARIYWRRSPATLIAITKNSPVYNFVVAIALAHIPQADSSAQVLIDDFLAPVSASKYVIFNPRQKVHHRQERLRKFWPWWLTIFPSSDTFQTKQESLVSQNHSNIELIITGVSILISAAWHDLDPHKFKEVALSMRISDPEITSAGDIFELIDMLIRFDVKETLLWTSALSETLREYLHKNSPSSAG